LRELNLELNIDGIVLACMEHSKFLSVIIDNKLSWSKLHKYINYISLKISRGLGVIGLIRQILPQNVFLTLYHSFIYRYLSYCCIVWGCATKIVLNRLVILQKRALQLITGSTYRSFTSPLFKLTDIYQCHIVQFMFKFINNLLPKACLHLCSISPDCNYETRHLSLFRIRTFRTNICKHNISVSGPKIWD